jgi:transcriptional regulator with XRE-family HTH domain
MLIFELASASAIGKELGSRIRAQRISQNYSMEALADQAGVSWGTVRNLETKGQASLGSLILIAKALGLTSDLATLFELKVVTISDMEKAARATKRRASAKRTPKKPDVSVKELPQ